MENPLLIKPHHFMDIIKLYGSGLERFVPDEKLGHDFYRVGNRILADPALLLSLTVEGDDICKPCRLYQGCCTDTLGHIPGIESKDQYNRLLDGRILALFELAPRPYTALELCSLLYEKRGKIFDVWKEEEDALTEKRFELFTKGARLYISQAEKA